MIRLGVVGCGFGAQVHLPVFSQMGDVQLQLIVCGRAEKAAELAQHHKIPHHATGFEALATYDLDAVTLALPPSLMGSAVRLAQQTGLHILAEKPVCISEADMHDIGEFNRHSGSVEMVDFQYPELVAFKAAKEVIESRQYGPPNRVVIRWCVKSYANLHHLDNWKRQRVAGGGVLNILGSHAFYYCRWLFGEIVKLRVLDSVPQQGDIAEHTVHMQLEFRNGVLADVFLSNNWNDPPVHELVVTFDKATLTVQNRTTDYMFGFSTVIDVDGKTRCLWKDDTGRHVDGRALAFFSIARRFIDAISHPSAKVVRPSMRDGIAVQRIIGIARRGVKGWQPVKVAV